MITDRLSPTPRNGHFPVSSPFVLFFFFLIKQKFLESLLSARHFFFNLLETEYRKLNTGLEGWVSVVLF